MAGPHRTPVQVHSILHAVCLSVRVLITKGGLGPGDRSDSNTKGRRCLACQDIAGQTTATLVLEGSNLFSSHPLHPLKVSSSIVVVHLALHNLLGQFTLPLTSFLRVLQLESVLIHWEPHCLFICQPESRSKQKRRLAFTLSSCSPRQARIRAWKASPGSRVA